MHFDSTWQRNTFFNISCPLIKVLAEICNVDISLKIEQIIYYNYALQINKMCMYLYFIFLCQQYYIAK